MNSSTFPVCDHEPVAGADAWHVELNATRADQERALDSAGFTDVECRLFEQQQYLVSAKNG